jgi:hypothetical protein
MPRIYLLRSVTDALQLHQSLRLFVTTSWAQLLRRSSASLFLQHHQSRGHQKRPKSLRPNISSAQYIKSVEAIHTWIDIIPHCSFIAPGRCSLKKCIIVFNNNVAPWNCNYLLTDILYIPTPQNSYNLLFPNSMSDGSPQALVEE